MTNPDEHEACCRLPAVALACPVCGKQGRKVGKETLDQHLAPGPRALLGDEAGFCPNPACEVVYFDGTATVRKGETLHAVTQKDPGDEVFVCYCFEHKRGDLRRDLAEKGMTDIPDRVKRGVKEGRCDCARKNPQGACCLGNIVAAINEIKGKKS
ncbi:MAG: copper chaperone Copz family protein [Elusimicrobia bacterium]|nr:copper chaperone Copz family protein [Elusimicrobiota bacterium]